MKKYLRQGVKKLEHNGRDDALESFSRHGVGVTAVREDAVKVVGKCASINATSGARELDSPHAILQCEIRLATIIGEELIDLSKGVDNILAVLHRSGGESAAHHRTGLGIHANHGRENDTKRKLEKRGRDHLRHVYEY